jgi:hypothetical protein
LRVLLLKQQSAAKAARPLASRRLDALGKHRGELLGEVFILRLAATQHRQVELCLAVGTAAQKPARRLEQERLQQQLERGREGDAP